jgi:hypothetical protein
LILAFLRLRFPYEPLSRVTGVSPRPREAGEKADFRDEVRALAGLSLKR